MLHVTTEDHRVHSCECIGEHVGCVSTAHHPDGCRSGAAATWLPQTLPTSGKHSALQQLFQPLPNTQALLINTGCFGFTHVGDSYLLSGALLFIIFVCLINAVFVGFSTRCLWNMEENCCVVWKLNRQGRIWITAECVPFESVAFVLVDSSMFLMWQLTWHLANPRISWPSCSVQSI